MSDKTTISLLGWAFLIGSIITRNDYFLICASIFFCTNYILTAIAAIKLKTDE